MTGATNEQRAPLDVLFLHVPKLRNYSKPLGSFSFILYPPIGLLGLADYLRQNGRTSRIVHLGVERFVSGSLLPHRVVSEHRPAIVGLDLHWHFQSYDVIEAARQIKQAHSNVQVLLGGFTASLFADEILKNFPFIDFVIRGDAEIPLLDLVRQSETAHRFDSIPNLSWRGDQGPVHNPATYVANEAMLNSICFTDFTLMKDYQYFIDSFARYIRLDDSSDGFERTLISKYTSYPVYIGRGCAYNCSFCGGGHETHARIGGRTCVALRSAGALVSSVRDLTRFGFEFACFTSDCVPPHLADEFYARIFDEITQLQLPIQIEVERDFLPSPSFLDSFQRLPGKKSFVTLSPHTHNEKLRAANGLHRYSNRDLEQCLDQMEERGINSRICFTCGLPFETREDLESLALFQKDIRHRYKKAQLKTCVIEIEPGSRMSSNPSSYQLRLDRTSFLDYYHYHSDPGRNHWLEMGYTRQGCPDNIEVKSFFCTHFCEKIGAGRFSPFLCGSLAALRKAGAFRLVDGVLALRPSRKTAPAVSRSQTQGAQSPRKDRT